MNILLVISSLGAGGGQRQISWMAHYWADKGWRVSLATFEDNNQENPHFNINGSVFHIPISFGEKAGQGWKRIRVNLLRLALLRKEIKKASPDVIISFEDVTSMAVRLASLGLRIPIIISQRTYAKRSDFYLGFWWNILKRITFELSDAIVVQTECSKEYYSRYFQRKIHVVPNQVKKEQIETDINTVRIERPAIVAMGRLIRDKGFGPLIESFSKVADQFADWKLYIFGAGPLMSELLLLREKLGLSDKVIFPGTVSNSRAAFSQADLFVLSSLSEGFPNVLCEAMAHGLPVISTDILAGPREIIRHEVDGILVPSGDTDLLASAMKRLMVDPVLRSSLSSRAIEVLERFHPDVIMKKWEVVISAVMESGGA